MSFDRHRVHPSSSRLSRERNALQSGVRDACLDSSNAVKLIPGHPHARAEMMREPCLPLATTVSSHMLPARHWIRPMRLPSQRAHTTRSICKIRCRSEIATHSPSCHATRRSTLAALAALLMQPSLTALADPDREQVGNPQAQLEIMQKLSKHKCLLPHAGRTSFHT